MESAPAEADSRLQEAVLKGVQRPQFTGASPRPAAGRAPGCSPPADSQPAQLPAGTGIPTRHSFQPGLRAALRRRCVLIQPGSLGAAESREGLPAPGAAAEPAPSRPRRPSPPRRPRPPSRSRHRRARGGAGPEQDGVRESRSSRRRHRQRSAARGAAAAAGPGRARGVRVAGSPRCLPAWGGERPAPGGGRWRFAFLPSEARRSGE